MSKEKTRRKKHKSREKVYIVKKNPFYKNIWFYISFILLINTLVTMIPNKTTNKVKIDNTSKKKNINSVEEKENKKMDGATEVKINETFSSEKLSVKINKVGETEEIKEGEFVSYKSESGKYALINVTIKNLSDKLERFESGAFKLVSNEKKYSPSIMIGLKHDYINFESLNPDMEMSGNLVFEVPKDVNLSDSKLLFTDSDIFKDSIIFKLK